MRDGEASLEAAARLFQQYGADAEVVATMRAAEVAAQMDVDALAFWDAVIVHLQSFDGHPPVPENVN